MVKSVATSIITVAALMGCLLACSSSDSEVAEPLSSSENTPEEKSLAEEPEDEPVPTPTPTLTVPAAPTDLRKATAFADDFSSGYLRIEWNAPTDTGGSPIISYTVTRTLSNPESTSDGTTDFCIPTTTSCTLTGHFHGYDVSPLPDRAYPVYRRTWTITVAATNSVGDSDPSEPITTSYTVIPDWYNEDPGGMMPGGKTCDP